MDIQLMFNVRCEQVLASPAMQWGVDDCCLFVADMVKEVCDVDLAHPFRGKYNTEEGAGKVLQEYGGGGLACAAFARAAELNLVESPPADDLSDFLYVGVCVSKSGPLLAIWNGHGWLVRMENGVASLPDHWAAISWKVPVCPQQS